MKDFLFFNYSWVPNSTIYFKSFIDAGYDCDIVDETNINGWSPTCKYKAVVMYLHCTEPRAKINHWLNNDFKDSFLIQHNDTDHEQIQTWTDRQPDLIMQRELSDWTLNPNDIPIEPFHFPIPSVYDASIEKTNDVMFYGCMTNEIRRPFAEHIINLSQSSLSHLKWDIKVTGNGQRTPEEYRNAVNKCKIGLHYFGNSRDSIRIWELASAKAAIIMPELKMRSVSESHMPFKEYEIIKDDFSDLEEKILHLLEDNKYKELADKSFEAYEKRHAPVHCCKYYQDTIRKYVEL